MSEPAAFLARLDAIGRRIFREMRLGAIFVEGYEGPVPRDWGDNQGVWPTRVRTTGGDPRNRARDTDYASPVHPVVLHAVFWFRDDEAAQRVARRVLAILDERKERLAHAWHNIPPGHVTQCVLWVCAVEDVQWWDDTAVEDEVASRRVGELERRVRARV